jgi:hypothetical protein
LVEDLGELRSGAEEGAEMASKVAPWFASYPIRLTRALELTAAGDERYLVSPRVASFHTVWSELHEDFLVSLSRERSDRDE